MYFLLCGYLHSLWVVLLCCCCVPYFPFSCFYFICYISYSIYICLTWLSPRKATTTTKTLIFLCLFVLRSLSLCVLVCFICCYSICCFFFVLFLYLLCIVVCSIICEVVSKHNVVVYYYYYYIINFLIDSARRSRRRRRSCV